MYKPYVPNNFNYHDVKKRFAKQDKRIEKLEIALRQIAAIDSTNDFTDSIIDIAEKALEKT